MARKLKLKSIEEALEEIRENLEKEVAKTTAKKKLLAKQIKELTRVIKLIPPICGNSRYDL